MTIKWRELAKERPEYGSLIWVWDNETRNKFVMRYFGEQETYEKYKNDMTVPLWAYINEYVKDDDE